MNRPAAQADSTAAHRRQANHPVAPIFINRWSPRAYAPIAMPECDLYTILEAARWAPSAFNIQPWRFVFAMRDDPHWDDFVGLLDAFNASWANNASALVFVVSDTLTPARGSSPARPSPTHSFDTGAAWAHLALQATALGYQAHAMAGIHVEDVRKRLSVPDRYKVEIAVAIGRQSDPSTLPAGLREREKPSSRLPLEQIAFAARLGADSDVAGQVSTAETGGGAQ